MAEAYLSIFSGIGGLEHPKVAPLLYCERDEACQQVLSLTHPDVPICDDIRSLHSPPPADFVVGGWPCQDISSAGTLGGILGDRSGLFFEMLRTATAARAHTLIGENVPNLLTINNGRDFQTVIDTLVGAGYPFIGWRVLNARYFGLPQQRRRLFIVASSCRERAEAIHAALPESCSRGSKRDVYGFYWTGGKRSICFSRGYIPALKIGATDNKGRAPVAVMIDDHVRKLSARECLRLQGFDDLNHSHPRLAASTLLRMAGNAVPRPMGHFVLGAVTETAHFDGVREGFGLITEAGLYEDGWVWTINHAEPPLADNLHDFLDASSEQESLSSQAAAGLLVRSIRAEQPMPLQLYDLLFALASNREGKLWPSRANSFEALDALGDELSKYRAGLKPISDYQSAIEEEVE
ncbi:MAG: DNA (cytosine-5-)-methyltransferase [Acidobacteria bacterium]|nr:DNA (cytosine-5-)-methyltransferase [Acidobacteriota bacterium]